MGAEFIKGTFHATDIGRRGAQRFARRQILPPVTEFKIGESAAEFKRTGTPHRKLHLPRATPRQLRPPADPVYSILKCTERVESAYRKRTDLTVTLVFCGDLCRPPFQQQLWEEPFLVIRFVAPVRTEAVYFGFGNSFIGLTGQNAAQSETFQQFHADCTDGIILQCDLTGDHRKSIIPADTVNQFASDIIRESCDDFAEAALLRNKTESARRTSVTAGTSAAETGREIFGEFQKHQRRHFSRLRHRTTFGFPGGEIHFNHSRFIIKQISKESPRDTGLR
ncbi:hypothetical protein [uncultured Victivallis sp.]|uniref:hypothetical protein n=1 Tax=uncultured Victivallis sp. TaxID=354118 RepID=UPI0025921A1D|nr:hypothetical protein [uncultured Victivallis sp.]